jgi:hypothetical protein
MKDIKVNLCGRYRFFVFFVSILVIWGVAWLIVAVVQGRIIDSFHLLKIGMSRDEIINIVGEPQHKENFKVGLQIIPEEAEGKDELVEYIYYKKEFASSSGFSIRGIFLDNHEETIEALDLRTEISDEYSLTKELIFIISCGTVTLFIWFLFSKWCRPSRIN